VLPLAFRIAQPHRSLAPARGRCPWPGRLAPGAGVSRLAPRVLYPPTAHPPAPAHAPFVPAGHGVLRPAHRYVHDVPLPGVREPLVSGRAEDQAALAIQYGSFHLEAGSPVRACRTGRNLFRLTRSKRRV